MRDMLCVMLILALMGLCGAAPAQDNAADDGLPSLPKGVRRIDGRVKEIDLKLMKIAVEVEVDPDKPAELVIFALTPETKVRKRENAESLDDIRKGMAVLVFYLPASKKGDPAKAVFIRILEGLRDYPRRPRRP